MTRRRRPARLALRDLECCDRESLETSLLETSLNEIASSHDGWFEHSPRSRTIRAKKDGSR